MLLLEAENASDIDSLVEDRRMGKWDSLAPVHVAIHWQIVQRVLFFL